MKSAHAVPTRRVYEAPAHDDGQRVLVDSLWPRGLSRERAAVDVWLKEIAPSPALRTWFGHDPERWPEFRERYFRELGANPDEVGRLAGLLAEGKVTLVFGARDAEHNNAVALSEFLARHRH